MHDEELKRKVRNYLRILPGDLFKVFIVLLFLFPFYWMMITAFKHYHEAIVTPPTLWPKEFTFQNFINIYNMNVDMTHYAINSIVVTLSVITIQSLIMVPAAYAFAKRRFPLQGIMFGIVMIAFMIPVQITYITTYLMMADWKLIKSLWPQILPFGANAFGIFMLRQAFKQIPDELVESAKLDSATEIQVITRIMLPMCKSSIITIAMFSFISHWNSYFWPLVMTSDEKLRPLTLMIEKIRDEEFGINWNTIMASNFILVVPVIIIFLFASKKIIEAFAYRGVK